MNNRPEVNSPASASTENDTRSRQNPAAIGTVNWIVVGMVVIGFLCMFFGAVSSFFLPVFLLGVAIVVLSLVIGGGFALYYDAITKNCNSSNTGAVAKSDDQTVTSSSHLITKTTGYDYGNSHAKSLAQPSETQKPSIFNKLSNKVSAVFNSLFSKGESKSRAEARDDLESSKLKL